MTRPSEVAGSRRLQVPTARTPASSKEQDRTAILRALRLPEAVPKFLGEKRHERMEQTKRRIKNGEKISPRGDGHLAMRGVRRSVRNGRLDPFHVPVAEVTPKEVIDGMRCFVETVMRERVVDNLDVMRQSRKDPAVGQRHLAGRRIRCRRTQFR